jgi:hypothetical protein
MRDDDSPNSWLNALGIMRGSNPARAASPVTAVDLTTLSFSI